MNFLQNFTFKHFLVFFVILIWGIVFYRYFFSGHQDQEFQRPTPSYEKEQEVVFEGELTLYKPMIDPFLSIKPYPLRRDKLKNVKRKKVKLKEIPTNVSWPSIRYMGFIKKQRGNRIALLKVGKKMFQVKKGEKIPIKMIYVKKIYKDSVVLKFKNKCRTIKVNR